MIGETCKMSFQNLGGAIDSLLIGFVGLGFVIFAGCCVFMQSSSR